MKETTVPNVFQNISFITNESMRLLKNNLQFTKNCNTDFESRFTETPKKGETIKVRKPALYVGRSGETYQAEGHTDRTVDMTVQETKGLDLDFTNRELMFNLERFSERVLAPAMQRLANTIDRAALELAIPAVANFVGVPGTTPTALKTFNQARALMSWEGAPQDNQHSLLVTPDMQVEIVDAGKSLFQSSTQIEQQYEKGIMGIHAGAKWYECQNLITHTTGPYGGTPAMDGANQSGSTIATKGWTSAAAARLSAGDVIEIAGLYACNPYTKQSTGALRHFVVTAAFESEADGTGDISISPAIVRTGALQNVVGTQADGALISIFSKAQANQAAIANAASPQGLRFHRDAFLFGSFDQPIPGGVEQARQVRDPQTGITLRFIRDWDTSANKQMNRFDVVWAFGVAYQELACRICG